MRGFTPRFAMTIGGTTVGYINSVKGGDYSAELQKLDPSSDNLQRKVVHGIKVTPFEIDIAMGMSKKMTEWIMGTIRKAHTREHGQLVVADNDLKAQVSQDFFEALITEVSFPALSGDGKQAAFLKVKFDPEMVHFKKESGAPITGLLSARAKDLSDKKWSFRIDGMPTGQCTKVDALTIKQEVTPNPYGDENNNNFVEKLPGKVEIGEISAEFAVTSDNVALWQQWATQWMLHGARGESQNKHGAIVYKAADGSDLAEIELKRVGLIEFGVNEAKGGANTPYKFKCKFFVEEVDVRMPSF